jgi:hypothetical protein
MTARYYHRAVETVSFKLPSTLRRRLVEEARRRRMSQSAVVRETLEAALLEHTRAGGELTCAQLAGDLVGSLRGPGDLSTNKRYLDEAIMADARRAKKRRR